MDSAEVYFVYCSAEKARELEESGQIDYLQSSHNVRITWEDGRYLVHRNAMPKSVHQSAKHNLIYLLQDKPSLEGAQWFWSSRNQFVPYKPAVNALLEAAYSSRKASTLVEISGQTYEINFTRLCQTQIGATYSRQIWRNPDPRLPHLTYKGPKDAEWRKLPISCVKRLQNAILRGLKTAKISLNSELFTADFESKTLTSPSGVLQLNIT